MAMPNIDPNIDVLSVTKPMARKEYLCAWSNDNPHSIMPGHKHVRVVYDDGTDKIITDRICINCWTKPV